MGDSMQWWALYIDGSLQYIRQWYGKPTVRDFGVGEMVGAGYVIAPCDTSYCPDVGKDGEEISSPFLSIPLQRTR